MTTLLSLSKELWEKGLRIDTEKWWNNLNSWQVISKVCNDDIVWRNEGRGIDIENYPAPSTDELLAVMPSKKDNEYLTIKKDTNNYYIVFYTSKSLVTGQGLPETLGKMCLWLLSNGWRYDEESKCLVKKED